MNKSNRITEKPRGASGKQTVCFFPEAPLRLFISLIFIYGTIVTTIGQDRFRLMEYNVENLFDTRHDTLKDDQEFLPEAIRKWTYFRYRQKLVGIAKVIAAASPMQPLDLIALCEVENELVLRDLTRYSPLKTLGYRYLITSSPDHRGIDVALLYQPGTFNLLSWRSIRIPSIQNGFPPTRDLLHATGKVPTGDTLDIFVCHLPSRSGGRKQSEPHRLLVATCLKAQTDSIMALRTHPRIIITGDFNDFSTNASIAKVLNAKEASSEIIKEKGLYDLMAGRKKEGTYRYQGEWNMLDHIIVSGTLCRPL